MRESSHSPIVKEAILEMTPDRTCLIAPKIEELHLKNKQYRAFILIIVYFIKKNHDMVISKIYLVSEKI